MNDSRLLVAIPSLYNPANYGRFSVCLLSPGVSYPPVYTVDNCNHTLRTTLPYFLYPFIKDIFLLPTQQKRTK